MSQNCYIVTGSTDHYIQGTGIYASLHKLMSLKYKTLTILECDVLRVLPTINESDIIIFANAWFLSFTKEDAENILARIKGYKVLISFDDEYLIDWTIYYSKFIDLVVTFDGVCYEYLLQIGVNSILCPHPFSLSSGESSDRHEYDISFIGSLNKYGRPNFIEKIKKIYPNSFFLPADGSYFAREDMLSIFKKTKININLTGITKIESGLKLPYMNQRKGFKGRPFEIGCVGGFCLSEYSPSIAKFLENGKHIVYFQDFEEAARLIDYYLDNENERMRIAVALNNEVVINYSDSSPRNILLENVSVRHKQWMNIEKKTSSLGNENIFVAGLESQRVRSFLAHGRFIKAFFVYGSVARNDVTCFLKINAILVVLVYRRLLFVLRFKAFKFKKYLCIFDKKAN